VIEGEKFPMSKNVFARMVMRLASDKLSVSMANPKTIQTTTRMWFNSPPPDGVSIGQFAQDAIDMFEANLKGYIGDN
jgi:hypothetical protein